MPSRRADAVSALGGRAGNTWGGAPSRGVPPDIPYGVGGDDDDGIANVHAPADAIPATAGYGEEPLCHRAMSQPAPTYPDDAAGER